MLKANLSKAEMQDLFRILNGSFDEEPHEGGGSFKWPTNDVIKQLKEKG